MTSSANDVRLDERSRAALDAEGLRYAVVNTADADEFDRWLQTDQRGFHFSALSAEQLAEYRAALADNRSVGVWDSTAAEPEHPIATVASWRSTVAVPGGGDLEAWAISAVSVAATHRRRGIARALLEGELRAAHAAGLPMAMLTVSEATIYGRWGFGPATYRADYRIDTRGLRLTAPLPKGRVHRVTASALRPLAAGISARARTAGEVPVFELYWDRLFGLSSRTASRAARLRAARYDDAAGEPQGFVVYSVKENPADFADHTVTVEYLCAASDDAAVALWHYVLGLDLVTTVVAALRPVDEPLMWLVSNPRAVHTTSRSEHLWLRVLDVPTALSARRYAGSGSVTLRVTDSLGFAEGTWNLSTDTDGLATVGVGETSPDAAVVDLGVEALGSLLLGGTPVEALRIAGRLSEATPGAAGRLDALLRTPRAPHLSYWF